MDEVARLLNEMVRAGVIADYAVFDAVAQMRYTEAVTTLDADILVSVPHTEALDVLSPIYAFCRERGFQPEGEAIRVGDLARVLALREVGAVTDAQIADLAAAHGLGPAWQRFLERFREP